MYVIYLLYMLYRHKDVYVVLKGIGRLKLYIEKMHISSPQSTGKFLHFKQGKRRKLIFN